MPDSAVAAGQTIALVALALSAFIHGVVVVNLPDRGLDQPTETLHIRLTPPPDAPSASPAAPTPSAAPSPRPRPSPIAKPQEPSPEAPPPPSPPRPSAVAATPMPPPPLSPPAPSPTPKAKPSPVASHPPSPRPPPPPLILPQHRVNLGAGPSEVNMDKEVKRTKIPTPVGSEEPTDKTQPPGGMAFPRTKITPPPMRTAAHRKRFRPAKPGGKPGSKKSPKAAAAHRRPPPPPKPLHALQAILADEEGDKPIPKGIGLKRSVAPRPKVETSEDQPKIAFQPDGDGPTSVPKGDTTEPAAKGEGDEGPDTGASPAPSPSPQGPDPDADSDGFVPLGTYLARQSGGRAPKIVPDWMASNLGVSGDIGLREYMEQVLKVIQAHRIFPRGGPFQNTDVRVRGTADGLSGQLINCRIVGSSGDRRVDKAALDTLWNSSPLPSVGTAGTLHFEMTLHFDPNDRDGG